MCEKSDIAVEYRAIRVILIKLRVLKEVGNIDCILWNEVFPDS
jgi:hypothetical protein